MNAHNYRRSSRRSSWITLLVIAAMILNLFPDVVPGVRAPQVQAHNLQTRLVSMFMDPTTQNILDARIASPTWPRPTHSSRQATNWA